MIELSRALVKTPYAYPKGYNHYGYQQIVYQILNYSGLLVARDDSPIPFERLLLTNVLNARYTYFT